MKRNIVVVFWVCRSQCPESGWSGLGVATSRAAWWLPKAVAWSHFYEQASGPITPPFQQQASSYGLPIAVQYIANYVRPPRPGSPSLTHAPTVGTSVELPPQAVSSPLLPTYLEQTSHYHHSRGELWLRMVEQLPQKNGPSPQSRDEKAER